MPLTPPCLYSFKRACWCTGPKGHTQLCKNCDRTRTQCTYVWTVAYPTNNTAACPCSNTVTRPCSPTKLYDGGSTTYVVLRRRVLCPAASNMNGGEKKRETKKAGEETSKTDSTRRSTCSHKHMQSGRRCSAENFKKRKLDDIDRI